jgi:4-hydroxy-tetrahydrodipicolinate reductase
MSRPVRVAVNGATGRMGRLLVELLRRDRRFELAAALTAPDAPEMGAPVAPGSTVRYSHDWSQAGALDVAIDFSSPAGLAEALAHCEARGVALVVGTTGLDAAMLRRLEAAGRAIPLLRSANFSLGVAVLARLLREAAAVLRDWDLEIVEAHHGRKVDAPSGTALLLGEAAAAARGTTLARAGVYAREGQTGPREPGAIGFAVVRGGDVVGEHTALLLGQGERVELGHRATDRSIFARGAIEAAHWLAGKSAGAYALDAMLEERIAGG